MIRTIKTVPSFNPKLKDYLIVATEEPKVYLIPETEFRNLIIEAGRKFNTLAPLAPYPNILGCEWKTNNTIYKWFVKRLKGIQEKYEFILKAQEV
ncbi:MAG: hypothetical protein JRD89_20045 [Deltaproteobacteria bacterium]|nr:hypothetical protein [Deltaproteobacteria bacterium]